MADPLQIVLEGVDKASGVISGVGSALGGLGNIAGGVLTAGFAAAAAGGAALAAGLGVALAAGMDNERMQASLAQVIKSTGGAAGMTADDVNKLAQQFMDLAGGSDDAIIAIETIGLRAGTVSSEEMPAFIQATLDLGAVMGDTASAATLLARAQDDPIAAFKRIERATGAYDSALEEQIKTLQEQGRTSEAVDLIMGKLAETTGGAAAANAETLSGQLEIMKGRLGEAAESIGTALLPLARDLFENVIAPAIPLIENIATEFAAFISGASDGSDLFTALSDAMMAAFGPETGGQITTVIGQIWDWLAVNIPIAIQTATDVINNVLIPAIGQLINWLGTNLPPILEAMAYMWTNTLQPALAAVGEFIVTTVIPALGQVIQWLATNLPPAIVAASDFMNNVLYPAMLQARDFIVNSVIPAVSDIINWLSVNLPPAIQTAADFWNNTLKPALDTIWNFIQNNVIPLFVTLKTWLDTNLPVATQALSDLWNNVLKPALSGVWDFINGSIIPLFTALNDVYIAGVKRETQAMTDIWQLNLLPALQTLWDYFNNSILPVLRSVSDFIGATLGPIIQGFIDNQITSWTNGLAAVRDAIQGVIGWLEDLANKIANIDLGPFQQHSPSEFEVAMFAARDSVIGLKDELGGLDSAMPDPDFSRWGARGGSRFIGPADSWNGGGAGRTPPGGGGLGEVVSLLRKSNELLAIIASGGGALDPAYDASFAGAMA